MLPESTMLGDAALKKHERVDCTAIVSPLAALGRATTVGANTVIGPGCVIGEGVRIGSYCVLGPNVTIEAASLGNRTTVSANTSIGGEPFLYVRDREKWLKLPSFGSVEIGDDVSLGSNVVIVRGAIDDT
jgi:UDP-3-O-[3-hydroxymyristoyl] glucosamine N-acyltransferase